MNFHSMSAGETIEYISRQKPATREKNRLKSNKKKSFLRRFSAQFSDFMTVVLLIAAAISFTAELAGGGDFIDPIIILVIVVLNAVLGVIEESKADNALEALRKISSPLAKIKRDGKTITVNSENVRVGDTLILEAGDCICADARLIKSLELETDESSLTGEAMPVQKEADCILEEFTPLAERRNTVFSASNVIRGKGEAIVTAIGMNTETGKIAAMLAEEEEAPTPLQKKLSETGKYLGFGALVICAVIFVMGLFKHIPVLYMFLTSVSLAVAAIPEGLPAVVTVVLAMGVQRMAKQKAIVKHLSAVEALGGATVICSDKTGTLTQNKMTVTEIFSDDRLQMFEMAALCCDNTSNPTENAILTEALRLGVNKYETRRHFPVMAEKPFDSERKLMSVLVKYHGNNRIVTKGAPEILLKKCAYCIDNGTAIDLSELKRREILSEVRRMAENALRVLAVAYKDTRGSAITENSLIFCGLIGIADPPRPEAVRAVAECISAGIRPVMITGDNKITARAVAAELGFNGDALSGGEISAKTDSELVKYSIFARVTPADKMRIVKAFQKNGELVAMTGDGVNDAPALKAADIGCSMGMNGTDVAKEASDIVLVDDNFATIVAAVREGRGIFENIKKSVHFLLSSNIGEIVTVFVGMLFGWEPPLLAIQLLWVNLVTDSMPALALGVDPIDGNIMLRPPKNPQKSLFADGLWLSICLEGAMIGALALVAFAVGIVFFDVHGTVTTARTMSFCVLSLSQLFHAFNMSSEHSVLNRGFFKNKALLFSLLLGIILQFSVVSFAPLARIFKASALNGAQWTVTAFLSVMPVVIVELQKAFTKKLHSRF